MHEAELSTTQATSAQNIRPNQILTKDNDKYTDLWTEPIWKSYRPIFYKNIKIFSEFLYLSQEKKTSRTRWGKESSKKGGVRKARRLEEEERKSQKEELKGAREGEWGGVGEEEWRWHRLKEQDVQRVCLSELPVVGFSLYRQAL